MADFQIPRAAQTPTTTTTTTTGPLPPQQVAPPPPPPPPPAPPRPLADRNLVSDDAHGPTGPTGAQSIATAPPPDPSLQPLQAAHDAAQHLHDLRTQLESPNPADRAAATAELLANGDKLDAQLNDLKALAGTPELDAASADLQKISEIATPDALAQQLQADRDLSHYPPGFAQNVAMLSRADDPALHAAIQGVGKALLQRPGGLSLDDVKQHPELAAIAGSLQDSPDPAVQGQLHDAVRSWAQASFDHALEGKEKKSGAKKATEELAQEMGAIGQAAGLDKLVDGVTKEVLKDKGNHKKLEHVAKKGEGFWDKVGDFVGDIAHDFSTIGKAVTTGTGFVFKEVGKGVTGTFHVAGKLEAFQTEMMGKVAEAGLNAVGAHGMAKKVEKNVDKVAHMQQEFFDGAGAAVGGTLTGVGQMISNPLGTVKGMAMLVEHPTKIVDVGKAIYKDATKGGAAYAAGYIAGTILPMILTGGATGGAKAATDVAVEGLEVAGETAAKESLSVGARIANVAREGVDAAKELPGKIVDGVKELPGKVVDGVKELPSDLKEVGKFAKDAVKDGLTDIKKIPHDLKETYGFLKQGVHEIRSSDVSTFANEGTKQFVHDVIHGNYFRAKNIALGEEKGVYLQGAAKTTGQTMRGVSLVEDAGKIASQPLSFVRGKIFKAAFKNFEEKFEISPMQKMAIREGSQVVKQHVAQVAR